MKQNEFYEVDGCTDFIPVKLIEEHKHMTNTLEVELTQTGYKTFVPHVYSFPKANEPQKVTIPKFVADWVEELKKSHSNLAWLDGYEVEQEKLYTVEIDGVSSGKLFKNIRTNEYLFHSGNGFNGYTDKLTETEIKQKDERLWQFAKEVEE